MFGVVFIGLRARCSLGPFGPSVPMCEVGADCNDDDACTTDTCGEEGNCVFADVECPEVQERDGGTCKTLGTADVDCDDGDACTDDAWSDRRGADAPYALRAP